MEFCHSWVCSKHSHCSPSSSPALGALWILLSPEQERGASRTLLFLGTESLCVPRAILMYHFSYHIPAAGKQEPDTPGCVLELSSDPSAQPCSRKKETSKLQKQGPGFWGGSGWSAKVTEQSLMSGCTPGGMCPLPRSRTGIKVHPWDGMWG